MAVAIGQLCGWARGLAGEAGSRVCPLTRTEAPNALPHWLFLLEPALGRSCRAPASWPGTGQWFGPHNQQDSIFGAACCLLPPLQGCDGADRSMAASQPGPSVPFPLWHASCMTISTHALICLSFSSGMFSLSWQH